MPAHRSTPVVPELTDGEVVLRALRDDDAPRMVEYATDERTRASVTGLPHPYRLHDAQAFLTHQRTRVEQGRGLVWAIEVGGDFMGAINCWREEPLPVTAGEIGYIVHPAARGRGVATRAARLAIAHAFDTWSLRLLRWRAAAGNLASRRVAWATGFTIDGTQPDGHPNSDGSLDDVVLGHLRHDDPREPAHPWWEPAVVEGNGIRLRPWRDGDVIPEGPDAESEAFSEGMQPTPEGYPAWLASRRNRMAHGEGVFWCVADAATDEPLGHLQVLRLNVEFTRGTGLVGYWAYPKTRGQGAIGRALELLIPHAYAPRTDHSGLSGLGLHRLHAGADLANSPSHRVLRRAGFRELAEEREILAHTDRPHTDAVTFELLASDDRDAQRVEPAPATVLTTERLRLRPWQRSDRPKPDEGPDDEARRQMPPAAVPEPDTFDAWLDRRNRRRDTGTHDFCIADAATDVPLGTITIFNIDRSIPHGEVGYWLYRSARGQGYLDEALAAVVAHGFRPTEEGGAGLDRLYAETNLTNYSSRGALLRAGFRRFGEDHQAYVVATGERTDGAYYELLGAWRDQPSTAVEVPTIEGERVRLRPWRMRDAARIVEAAVDPTTRHWLPQLPSTYNVDIAREYVHGTRETAAAGTATVWCVADRETDEALGSLEFGALRGPRPDTASIGYWAHPDARGRGAMTEGVSLAIEHAFAMPDEGGLDRRRLVLTAAEGNDASQAIARRHGFRHTGTDHKAEVLRDGAVVDMLRFELLRDAPQDRGSALVVPTLEGDRIRLRRWRLADAPRIVETCTDPTTRHWLANLPEPYTEEAGRAYVRHQWSHAAEGSTVGWCVADRDSDACVGAVNVMGLRGYDSTAGEIGYWTHPDARGRGVMTEAVGLAVTHAFASADSGGLDRRRLTVNVADGNAASVTITARHGFTHVGTDRRAEPLGDGRYVDLLRFDRLRD